MADKRESLIKDNIFKLMLQLSVPGIIGMLVISLYSFVDAIFVGRFVGASALGAISLAAERSEERRVGKECRSRWSPYH